MPKRGPVRIEAHVGRSKEAFTVVGLPDTSVREAKDRVRAAIISTGREFPHRRVTVNLSPANLPKAGSDYDLPMALGVLAAMGEASPATARVVAAGELSLDGSVSRTRSAIGAALLAARRNWPCLVAEIDAAGAAHGPGSDHLSGVHLGGSGGGGGRTAASAGGDASATDRRPTRAPTSRDVRGQPMARRALEIAAAGGHHLLMVGSPGAGKTMLAARLPGILPPLTAAEAVEVACVWASADRHRPVSEQPPFRSPHHSASMASVVGGGSGHPVPGELSLAHRGVLFMDELGEFPPHLAQLLASTARGRKGHDRPAGLDHHFPGHGPADRGFESVPVRVSGGPAASVSMHGRSAGPLPPAPERAISRSIRSEGLREHAGLRLPARRAGRVVGTDSGAGRHRPACADGAGPDQREAPTVGSRSPADRIRERSGC